MNQRQWLTVSLNVIGVVLCAYAVVYLAQNIFGLAYARAVGNPETVAMHFAPDYYRAIFGNAVQIAVGVALITKKSRILAFLEKNSDNG